MELIELGSAMELMNATWNQAAPAARQAQQLFSSFVGPPKRRQKEEKIVVGGVLHQ